MKKIPDIDTKSQLIDAMLADENWTRFSASLHPEALGILRARRRARSVRIALAQSVSVLGLVICVFFLSSRLPSRKATRLLALNPSTMAKTASQPLHKSIDSTPADTHFINEDQMVKMFPAGSCIVAEVNGQPRLVFFERDNGNSPPRR